MFIIAIQELTAVTDAVMRTTDWHVFDRDRRAWASAGKWPERQHLDKFQKGRLISTLSSLEERAKEYFEAHPGAPATWLHMHIFPKFNSRMRPTPQDYQAMYATFRDVLTRLRLADSQQLLLASMIEQTETHPHNVYVAASHAVKLGMVRENKLVAAICGHAVRL
jgi:uncharacterized protein (DUF849 family)